MKAATSALRAVVAAPSSWPTSSTILLREARARQSLTSRTEPWPPPGGNGCGVGAKKQAPPPPIPFGSCLTASDGAILRPYIEARAAAAAKAGGKEDGFGNWRANAATVNLVGASFVGPGYTVSRSGRAWRERNVLG